MAHSELLLMTPREAKLAIKGFNNRVKAQYYHTEAAFYNVYGLYNVKGFKPQDPFGTKMNKKEDYKMTSLKQREETLSYLFNK